MAIEFVLHRQVLTETGYSRGHLWRLERQGRFPARVHLGPGKVAWPRHEIEAWKQDKLSKRAPNHLSPGDCSGA